MKERSLVWFTLLSQTSVGTFLSLLTVHLNSQESLADMTWVLLGQYLVSGGLILASFVTAFTHLGSPRQAWRALGNLGSSWLSREIFFGLLYALGGASFVASTWLPGISAYLIFFLATMSAAAGLAFIYSMGRLYMLRTVPIWNTLLTPLTFFLSALSLGALLNLGMFSFSTVAGQEQALNECRQFAIIWLSLQVIAASILLIRLQRNFNWPVLFSPVVFHQLRSAQLIRLILLLIACLAAGILLAAPLHLSIRAPIALGTFTIALLSEIIGRVGFYRLFQRSGV